MGPPGESTAARERELARLRALADAADAWARWRRGDASGPASCAELELLAALDRLEPQGEGAGRELIVLCSGCRRTRDDSDWIALEAFLTDRAGMEFTHGLCPDCMVRLYPHHTSESDAG
jgi:hypothetical protein